MALTLKFHLGRPLVAISAICLTVTLGCGKSEQIQTYTVPKEPKLTAIATPTDEAKPGEPTDRMLAAILPAGGQAWFFKAVGPIAEIDKHEKEINDFFAALTLTADGRANWKLPADWKEEAGNQMRVATIVIPGDKRLEITVNTASWPGTQESMLANVNRWRGQLQLPPIGAKQLPDVSHDAKAGDRPITIVDMRGQFKSGGMTPPFARGAFGPRATGGRSKAGSASSGLPEGHPPIDATASPSTIAAGGLPASHPPIDALSPPAGATAATASPSSEAPKFTLAPSWKSVPAQGMAKAELVVSDGPQEARVKIFAFPADAGPMIADPLGNINRWRGEIGFSPLDKGGLAAATKPIEIDGQPATYAPMIPDTSKPEESQSKEATLAAIAKIGDQVWFIKMRGERELVKKHEDEFKAFLKTLKFSHDNEAGHGNK
jgi:hypothetical protein